MIASLTDPQVILGCVIAVCATVICCVFLIVLEHLG